jgi:hypothetical protein
MKLCKICNQQKPKDAFYKKSSGLDGLQSRCIDCNWAFKRRRKYTIKDNKIFKGFQ